MKADASMAMAFWRLETTKRRAEMSRRPSSTVAISRLLLAVARARALEPVHAFVLVRLSPVVARRTILYHV
eukprot:scaffold1197_cov121-Isochrysis_galbana.AAC.7